MFGLNTDDSPTISPGRIIRRLKSLLFADSIYWREYPLTMKMTYDAFTAAGFSHKQSLALTAEVGRENGFQEKFMFGTHSDPYNNATNLGMLSMQGPRLTNLKEALKNEGRFDVIGVLFSPRFAILLE